MNYEFTFRNEAQQGVSTRPHWPGGKSGVTIGAGYDLGGKSAVQVKQRMLDLGLDSAAASRFAQGAGLKGKAAEQWAKANHDLLISEKQERGLYRAIVPHFEKRTQATLDHLAATSRIPPSSFKDLDNDQRGLLFDYEYNGVLRKFPSFTKAVLSRDWAGAIKEHVRFSNGKPLGRRNDETLELLNQLLQQDQR